MASKWLQKLLPKASRPRSFLREIVAGSMFNRTDLRSSTSLEDIQTQIDVMRALARDSQINTALSYYATDATTVNTKGQIIWATPVEDNYSEVADIINTLLRQWDVNSYARDHILELGTIGTCRIAAIILWVLFAVSLVLWILKRKNFMQTEEAVAYKEFKKSLKNK